MQSRSKVEAAPCFSRHFTLNLCYNATCLGRCATAARRTLDPFILVRIRAPQPVLFVGYFVFGADPNLCRSSRRAPLAKSGVIEARLSDSKTCEPGAHIHENHRNRTGCWAQHPHELQETQGLTSPVGQTNGILRIGGCRTSQWRKTGCDHRTRSRDGAAGAGR